MNLRDEVKNTVRFCLTDVAVFLDDPVSELPVLFAEALHEVLTEMQVTGTPIGRGRVVLRLISQG